MPVNQGQLNFGKIVGHVLGEKWKTFFDLIVVANLYLVIVAEVLFSSANL